MTNIQQAGSVTSIYIDIAPGQEYNACFMSDNHFDAPQCNRRLMTKHLDRALSKNAAKCSRLHAVYGEPDSVTGKYCGV